jgi:hypothetical protein
MTSRQKYKSIEEIDELITDLKHEKNKLAARRFLKESEQEDFTGPGLMGPKERELSKRINTLKAAKRARLAAAQKRKEKIAESKKLLGRRV